MTTAQGKRAPFGRGNRRAAKRAAGATDVATTPLSVRTTGLEVSDPMRDTIRSRMGAKLGKYAGRIERLSVRFEDVNGPRGGLDTVCRVKVVLSGLDSVVFESRASDIGEALSLAATGIERAVRRTLERAGSTRKSANSSKPDSNLRRRQTRRVTSSKARATRSAAARP